MRKTVEERFWAKVNKSADCWIWMGGKTQKGYGHLYITGRTVLASRLSYEYAHGSIPEGMQVLHRCDNPPCVNPDHLFLGTQQDNIDDMVAKGRQRWTTNSDEWRRQVLANIKEEKAKYAEKVPVKKTRISKWADGTYQLTVWYSNGGVHKSGPYDRRADAVKARRAAY